MLGCQLPNSSSYHQLAPSQLQSRLGHQQCHCQSNHSGLGSSKNEMATSSMQISKELHDRPYNMVDSGDRISRIIIKCCLAARDYSNFLD